MQAPAAAAGSATACALALPPPPAAAMAAAGDAARTRVVVSAKDLDTRLATFIANAPDFRMALGASAPRALAAFAAAVAPHPPRPAALILRGPSVPAPVGLSASLHAPGPCRSRVGAQRRPARRATGPVYMLVCAACTLLFVCCRGWRIAALSRLPEDGMPGPRRRRERGSPPAMIASLCSPQATCS